MKWQLVITPAGFHLRLRAANGEPIVTSEVYESEESARHALSLVRRSIDVFSALQPDVVDERPKPLMIVAPTYYAAAQYVEQKKLTARWRNISNPDQLRGHNDPSVHVLGYPGWWTQSHIEEFERNLVVCDRGNADIVRVDKEGTDDPHDPRP